MYVYNCGFVYITTVLIAARDAVKSSRNGGPGCCGSPGVGAGSQTQVFKKMPTLDC